MPKTFSSRVLRKTYFTVGPSQIYPTVPIHVENAIKGDVLSLSHRGSEFKEIYKKMDEGLRKLLNIPDNYEIVVLSSALEAMERVLLSMSHNNSFHILSGFFGETWMGISRDLSKSPESFQFFDWEKNLVSKIPFEKIKIPKRSELVCITQNDTSVGFSIPMEKIYKLKKNYPDKLFALDIVSSVPYVDIEYKYLDAVFFSVQKGFGLPAGLSVLILSPNSLKKAKKLSNLKNYSIGSYHDLIKLASKSRDFQTNETPNVLGIYLLACVVKDFSKIGISTLRNRLDKQAQMLYSFFSKPEDLGSQPIARTASSAYLDTQNVVGEPFIKEEKYRSITTPVFEISGGSEQLRRIAAEKSLILGAGYKDFKNKHIRIGNFPALTDKDFEKLIKVFKKLNLKLIF
jgi:phosphoserine aminotransferase